MVDLYHHDIDKVHWLWCNNLHAQPTANEGVPNTVLTSPDYPVENSEPLKDSTYMA
jgi:hypothetical protein